VIAQLVQAEEDVLAPASRASDHLRWAAIRQLKSAPEHDMTVRGADLAGQAIKAGLADELRLLLVPVVVGGGKRALPNGVRWDWNYWSRSGSQAVLSTSGTAPSQHD
jgi:dihydrofolate reductase